MSVLGRKAVRRSAVAAGACLALVVAFVGYGAWTRKGPVHYARGGQDFLSAPQVPLPQVTSSQAPAAVPVVERPLADRLPDPQVKGRQVPAPHVRTTSQATAPLPGPAGSRAATPPPAPGRYGLRVSGSEDVRFGPVSFCGRDFPAESELVVTPAVGEPAGSYNFDVRYYPGAEGKHDERRIYRYTAGGVQQGFEGATVTCGGIRQSSDVAYAPVPTRVQLPLSVGQIWSGTTGDADRTETYRTRVTGTDSVTVGGVRVPVYVIETDTGFTGAEQGTRTQRWWYSPRHAMPLRWSDRTQGGRSGATYTAEVTVSVVSLPATEQK